MAGRKIGGERFEGSKTGRFMHWAGRLSKPNQQGNNALSGNNNTKESSAINSNIDNSGANDSNAAFTSNNSNASGTNDSGKPHEGLVNSVVPKDSGSSTSNDNAFKGD